MRERTTTIYAPTQRIESPLSIMDFWKINLAQENEFNSTLRKASANASSINLMCASVPVELKKLKDTITAFDQPFAAAFPTSR